MDVRVADVHKSFPLPGNQMLEILHGCTFHVPHGKRMVVIGPSGVGKSTLLHILGLLDAPTSGAVYWDGQRVDSASASELAIYRNRDIGFVFQHHYLLSECTAMENVLLPKLISGKRPGQARSAAQELLQAVGLSHRLNFYPRQLSGGERQRVALARALVNYPKLLLADEVTGSLDPTLKDEMMQLLLRCCATYDATLIAVTHDFSLIRYYDTVYELEEGRLRESAPP